VLPGNFRIGVDGRAVFDAALFLQDVRHDLVELVEKIGTMAGLTLNSCYNGNHRMEQSWRKQTMDVRSLSITR